MKRLLKGEAYRRTDYGIVLQPLFIKFPLVANKDTKRALMPLFFSFNLQK
jgi:hypothetical protein